MGKDEKQVIINPLSTQAYMFGKIETQWHISIYT